MAAHEDTIAIIGDLSGHAEPFTDALISVGVDVASGTIPEGLTVIQLGDLIHKGPDSDALVALADQLLAGGDGRYIQLLGNHEGQYAGGVDFWRKRISARSSDIIASWVADGRARLAVAVDSDELGPTLLTHAGLTHGLWQHAAGSPTDPGEAAFEMNHWPAHNPELAHRSGFMLGGQRTCFDAGPLWAHVARELYQSWAAPAQVPFSMVHGHTSAVTWNRKEWDPAVSAAIRARAEVDWRRRHVSVPFGEHRIVGIDPGFGSTDPARILHPLIVHGHVI